jgi:hypothetical protein
MTAFSITGTSIDSTSLNGPRNFRHSTDFAADCSNRIASSTSNSPPPLAIVLLVGS